MSTTSTSTAPSDKKSVEQYRENWQAEIDGANLYRTLALTEARPQLAKVYQMLAEEEAGHARIWEEKLREAGVSVPQGKPGWRMRALTWVARRAGPRVMLPAMAGLESMDSRRYDSQAEARRAKLHAAERSHAAVLTMAADRLRESGDLDEMDTGRLESLRRNVEGNALRAAVLGSSDGLVCNLSLVMGVAGAALSPQAILITGLAGLLAGASSMALGEWLSVQSSRELHQRQIEVEKRELEENPEGEARKLELIYRAKSVPEEQAHRITKHIMLDRQMALDTIVREELGIDLHSLGGSAWEASILSFILFAIGAIIPVLPFMFTTGLLAVTISLAASTVGLYIIGATITLMTGRSAFRSGMREVIIGLAAAAITFGIGRLLGVAVAG